MKNILVCLGLITLITTSSCDKKVEKTTETIETNTVVRDTVVKEVPPKEEGTSVKINNEGIDVDSKDVKVEVKK